MGKLTPIAGGATGGLWWWQSKKDTESVLDVYNRTLAKGSIKKEVESASMVVKQAASFPF